MVPKEGVRKVAARVLPDVREPATTDPRGAIPPRWGRLVSLVVMLALVVAACGGGSESASDAPDTKAGDTASERAQLRVAFVPATTALPLHVAKAQGFFEKNNLDVTLTEASNISDIPATLGRQFDISMGTATDLIRAGAAGIDVVQVAGNTISTKENPFVQVITRPESGITDVAGLSGKTVGSPTLSGVIHAAVLYSAKEKGADPASIKGVQAPPPNLPDQLKAGQVDAVEALEPFASQLKKAGNVSLGDPFSPIADPLATNFFIAQGKWAKAERETVDRFVASLEEAKEFIASNDPEARRILREYTGLPEPVAASVPLPTYDFEIRKQDLATWTKVLREIGQLDRPVDPDKLVLK